MTEREAFERQFDDRTVRYTPGFESAETRPVVIGIGPDAHHAAGHLLLSSLVNQVARLHSRIVLVGELDYPLECPDVFGHRTLRAATADLATEIHPWREIETSVKAPAGEAVLRVAIGQAPGSWDLCVGADGWRACFGPDATVTEDARWGAAYASCLTAAAIFHAALGESPRLAGELSLWSRPGVPAGDGPVGLHLTSGPILQVGAGAVGCALAYWAILLGHQITWTIVDRDIVDISNLNRQLLFRAADAFANANKAQVVAQLLGSSATSVPLWYDEAPEVVQEQYDLVLPLANDRSVRTLLHHRNEPMLLHATTSRSWQAQLHRHTAGIDDCINCRIPEGAASLRCSGAPITPGEPDSALPFLSATAGLLLSAEVARRALDEPTPPENFTSVTLRRSPPEVRFFQRNCLAACPY